MSEREVIVVGAGPAGIAGAVALKDRGVSPLVLDQADEVGSSWRIRYDRLRLNTSRVTSRLPGRRFPKGTPMFPTRDQVIEYLQHHAHEDGIELQLGTRVERVERANGGWVTRTSAGEIAAPQVIVATGYEELPSIPDWSGRDDFGGSITHSSDYRNPVPFEGKSVLVVGAGCSGMEIAYDLAANGAGRVWLAVRTPPSLVMREGPGGLPGEWIGSTLLHLPVRLADRIERFGRRMDFGDLSEYGLPMPEEGLFARYHREGTVPAIVDKEVIEAIKSGRIEVVRAVEALEVSGAKLADGSRVEPDAIVCATGYERTLGTLVGHLGVLDEREAPRAQAEQPAAPGLRFLGYITRPGALGYMGKQAKRAARAIARELASA